MAGDPSKTNSPLGGKRLAAETNTLKRALDGSAFVRCEACNKDVPAALIDLHGCSVDPKIRMSLEARVVEKPAPRKKAASSDPNESQGKKDKKSKASSAPKRSPTAIFLFIDEFRKTFKEADPDSKTVYAVLKEGVGKWKSMTDEEKKPYVDREAELKAEYEKEMVKLNEDNEEEDEEEKEESEKKEEE